MRQRTREGDGVGRADAEQHAAEKPADAERRDDAERGADRAEPQASSEKSANDRQARRAERHADADFVRALFDGVRHQPVGAHRGQRHAGHAEDEQHRRRQVEEDQRARASVRPAAWRDRIGRSASSAATCARAWSTSTSTGAGPRVCRIMLDRYDWRNGR